MLGKSGKRFLSLVLAIAVIFSSVIIQGLVMGVDIGDKSSLKSLFGIEDGDPAWDVMLEMNEVITRYLGTGSATDAEIAAAVAKMDEETLQYAEEDIAAVEKSLRKLSRDEREALLSTQTAKTLGSFQSAIEAATTLSTAASATCNVLDGKVSVIDNQGTGSVSGGTVTITVKGGLAQTKSNTIDIYNNTDKAATVKFDYKATDYKEFALGGSGTYSALIYPDKCITLTLTAGTFYQNSTLVLSNFSYVEAQDVSTVTFDYDSAYGSVTVGGAAVEAGDSAQITLAQGATLTAAAKNSGKFLGWIDPQTNHIYTTSADFKLNPVNDMTVKAVFVGANSNAYFSAGTENYLFDDLNKAASLAANSGNKTVVVLNDGVLPAGNYTIPAGVTLLVPFDSANTSYTTEPEVVGETRTTPTAYRTLTMASGANITVNGTISVPAKHYAARGSKANGGSPDGPCGFIKMQSGSNIILNSGAALYAYGFIIGSGNIIAKSGSNVYEYFQIMDFRGGTQTTEMENGVFPLSQYYVQNIEAPLTLEAGSVESSYTTVYISKMNLGSAVSFIAKSGAMFNLTSGSVTKRYDPATDRLVVEVDGNISIDPIEMKFGTGILSKTINSKNYELPINSNITVKVNSGTITLNQDISMLPGAEIVIGENARCVIGSGTNVYLYDSDEWGGFCAPSNKKFIPVQYAPGRKYNRKESDLKDAAVLVNGTLDASRGYVYTTAGGANIYSTGSGEALIKKGSQTVTYQLVQNSGYSSIPITPAKLKNSDGTYKAVTSASASYYFMNGVWVEHTSHMYTEVVTAQPDCENTGLKTFTCPCGSTYTEVIPSKGHSLSAEATCTTAQTCLTCGKTVVGALGHNYRTSVTAPTCTEKGYTTHTCQRCGDTYTDSEVAAKGHKHGAAATCTSNQVCTVCGIELAPELGHNYKVNVVKPTCEDAGYTIHTCANCGDTYKDSEVDALGHTAGAAATCTEPQTCTVCGEVLKSENGHTPGSEATCTEAQICLVCGDTLANALGHNMIHDDAQDSTCTEEGYSSGSRCTRCGHTEGKQVIPAKGHKHGAAATCTSNQICTVCGEVVESALGHNYTVTVVAPSCTEKGYTVYNCRNCGDSYKNNYTDAKAHTPGAEATCTEAQYCTDCGEITAPAKGHTAGAATCTEAAICTECGEITAHATGHKAGKRATCISAQICTECGEELKASLGHRFVKTSVESSCTENGSTVYTCSRCRYSYIETEITAKGHNMSAATCTEPATCTDCGHTEGEALGHTEVADEGMPAFCNQEGYTDGSHCSVCGEVIVAQETIPALGHNLEYFEAKAPTYTSVGWEAYEDCTRCAYTTYVEIPKLETPTITDFASFIENLALLEELANSYASEVPGKDPVNLLIKYIRTGVEDYTDGSWGIMAGYEDAGFAEYVARIEDEYNSMNGEVVIAVSALKNIELFELPNGDLVDFGHMFGAFDITYHNKTSANHADVAGWAGDIVDLIEFSDYGRVEGNLDELMAQVAENYFLKDNPDEVGGFNQQDVYADLDSVYIMQTVIGSVYESGSFTKLFEEYFTEDLTLVTRADYFLKNRLGGASTRADVRNAVYNAYTGNKLISTLEGTREFNTEDISTLRKACCYVFADYICKLAGDYVEVTENPYFSTFSSESSNLAPGVIQHIKQATTADNKQMVYYTATADLSRDDVHVYANYKDNDPSSWGMQTVLGQATAAQNKYGDPESEHYIENYNVIASINGDGYNMETGEPGGLLIMDGKEYHGIDKDGFFGITKDGKAVIGTMDEYNSVYRGQIAEGIGGFGSKLIEDGKIKITGTTNYFTDRASRTAVGITRTGKVVFMVLDGRQEPISCGGSMIEIAQIMFEAGCVEAINLDGGGSTTYVAKVEGADKLSVVSRPSDGVQRSVSTSLMIVSTAPSSTAFDHAIIESETDYLTKDSSVQLIASGVSATGNAAEIPEGAYWTVSDEKWATVTEDGMFTGLRNGVVEVYLMLEDEIIGSKTMNIVVPDRIYFTKTNLDVVYGSATELPIAALYENKPVTIRPEDVLFSLSNSAAGTVNGFAFTGTEGTGIKNVVLYAALANDETVKAELNISLYNQGEITFDFDKATGGDRIFAWDRKVSNSTTEDNYTYEIVNADEAMETSYVFAIDMTQIPIPEQLADLTTMLPGAELEGASAWTFLLQLAERVSVLTEVKPTIKVDKNFDIDYSEIKVVNDYFKLTNTEFDEENNTLTLTLNWIDQTQAIDPAMANPLCILNGIKLTPKDGVEWPKDKLTAVNTGEVSYKMYMRANALYSFAQKTDNQQIYGIYPFVNPNDANEKGGWFGDVYAQFEDTYVLSKAVKDGWVNEEGGFAYYVDGVKYTGVKLIDGYYYDFGENGINVGQEKYTGLFLDEAENVYRYAKFGELQSGWQMIGTDWYYFHSSTLAAKAGYYRVGDVYYNFGENGLLLTGVWCKTLEGTRYYYGPSYYFKGWYEIDGKEYYFRNGYRYEGLQAVKSSANPTMWYDFGDDGACKGALDGIYYIDGIYYYIENGIATEKHLVKVGDDYYYATYNGKLAVNTTLRTASTNCDLPKGTYTFGPDGKMIGSSANGEIVELEGILYYYENGVGVEKGLVKVGDDYYYAAYKGKLVVSKVLKTPITSCDLPNGRYEFGADGKMLDGIVEKEGVLYYYETGVGVEKGLISHNGDYYYAAYKGQLVVSQTLKAALTSCDLPAGKSYEFGADGKMLNGIVEKDGVLYFYENGAGLEKGLISYNGDYYYAAYKGQLAISKTIKVTITSCDLPAGISYEFGSDGKMLDGMIEKDGVLYYYENGQGAEKGLICYNGDYYYTVYNGRIVVSQEVKAVTTSCDLPAGKLYEFGADGKMLSGIIEKEGVLYYYENGQGVEKGLISYNGDYYYAAYKGKLAVSKSVRPSIINCDLPKATYEFGADGKMLNGIVEKDGVLYYYENGQGVEKGLICYNGDYYYAAYKGKLAVSKSVRPSIINCDLPKATYEFGADGKMLNGIVEKDGALYYYENGQGVEKGIFYLDGHYYYAAYKGLMAVNKTIKITATNNLLVADTYTFNEYGQIVG